MVKHILVFITCILAGSVSLAGAEPVLLYIRDGITQTPIEKAGITLNKNKKTYTYLSNQEGLCQIPDSLLNARMTVQCLGYEPHHAIIKQRILEIRLNPSQSELQTIVVTGQSKAIQQRESMYSVQTLNAKELQQRGAVTLNDALQFNVNQWISQDNVLGSSLNLGGIGGQNIKILMNGIPITGRENGNIDLGQINLQHVKRIEIIQGPMSVLYGSNAMGGVINLITDAGKINSGAKIQTYLESIGKINLSGSAFVHKKNHHLNASIARNFFDGWTSQDTGGRFQLWKPKEQYIADWQYQYTPNEKTKLGYFGSYLNETISNLGAPIINPFEAYGFDEYYKTRRLMHSINTEHAIGKKGRFISTNAYTHYERIKNRFKKDLVELSQFETAGTGDQDTSQFNTLNFRGMYARTGKNHEWQSGYEITHETGESFKLRDSTQRMIEAALFTSWNYRRGAWRIQPALRAIYNNRFAPALTPSLHAHYTLSPKTILRSSLAWGYRTPSLKELYLNFIDQNHTLLGNENLKPENGFRWENSAVYTRIQKQKSISCEALLAYNQINNMIYLAAFPGNALLRQYANIDQYQNINTQLRIELKHPQWQIQLGGGFTRVFQSTQFPGYSLLDAALNASYNLPKTAWRINANYKINNRQALLTIDNQFYFTQAIHLSTLSLQRQFLKQKLMVQVGLKNLLNQQNSPLNSVNNSTSGHLAPGGMNIAPARSLFLDTRYNF